MRKHRFFLMAVVLLCISCTCLAAKLDVSYRAPEMVKLDIETIRSRVSSGDTEAQFELGIRMILGEGVKKDKKAGIAVLHTCYNAGNLRCSIALGDLDKITYCNLEPRTPCDGYYGKALHSSDTTMSQIAAARLAARNHDTAGAILCGIASGLNTLNNPQ